MDFLLVIMAGGIARGRVRTTTTTTTESRNMAAKHQTYAGRDLQPWFTVHLDIHVMLNWHLSIQGICWPVLRAHVAGSSLELIKVTWVDDRLSISPLKYSNGQQGFCGFGIALTSKNVFKPPKNEFRCFSAMKSDFKFPTSATPNEVDPVMKVW